MARLRVSGAFILTRVIITVTWAIGRRGQAGLDRWAEAMLELLDFTLGARTSLRGILNRVKSQRIYLHSLNDHTGESKNYYSIAL